MLEDQFVEIGDAYRILKTPLISVRTRSQQGNWSRWITTHDHELDLEDSVATVLAAHPEDDTNFLFCVSGVTKARVTGDRIQLLDNDGTHIEIKFLKTRTIKDLQARLLLGVTRNNQH
jgi:hypothetical protein